MYTGFDLFDLGVGVSAVFLLIGMIFAGLGTVYVAARLPKDIYKELVDGFTGTPKNVWIFTVLAYWIGFVTYHMIFA